MTGYMPRTLLSGSMTRGIDLCVCRGSPWRSRKAVSMSAQPPPATAPKTTLDTGGHIAALRQFQRRRGDAEARPRVGPRADRHAIKVTPAIKVEIDGRTDSLGGDDDDNNNDNKVKLPQDPPPLWSRWLSPVASTPRVSIGRPRPGQAGRFQRHRRGSHQKNRRGGLVKAQ